MNNTVISPVYPMLIQKYNTLIPDPNANVLDKINSIIDYLNQTGKLTNDVVNQWNQVMSWAMNDGLTTDVSNKLETMLSTGEFDTLFQKYIAPSLGDIKTLQTNDKTSAVNAINEVDQLAKSNATALTSKANQSDLNTTNSNVSANTQNIATNTQNIASNTSSLADIATIPSNLQTGNVDNTTVLQNLINNATSAGLEIKLPPGIYKCNLLINKSNIKISGAGTSSMSNRGGQGGTILMPYDLTKPCIQIGDGTNYADNISLNQLSLLGDQSTSTSDGLVINGASWCFFNTIDVNSFGGDNIRIQCTANVPTFYIFFDNLISRWARKSNFNVIYGASYVTSVYINNVTMEAWSTVGTSTLFNVNKSEIYVTNAYLDTQAGCGINMSNGAKILGSNMVVDSSNGGIMVTIDQAPTVNITDYLVGSISMSTGSTIKFSDGSTVSYGARNSMANNARMAYPYIFGGAYFSNGQDNNINSNMKIYGDGSTNFMMQNLIGNIQLLPQHGVVKIPSVTGYYPYLQLVNGNNNNATGGIHIDGVNLQVDIPTGGNFQVPDMTWNGKHLMFGAYHLWMDSTGRLRYKASSPSSDTDGALFAIRAQSSTAVAIANNGTITSTGLSLSRVAPTSAVTGIILQSGTFGGQECVVINESTSANSVTFAATGSNVADGSSDVINGGTARQFIWDSGTSLWYRLQ